LLCDPQGVIAVDARIRVQAAAEPAQARLAIRPYPQRFEGTVQTHEGGRYAVRPIRPEDEPALRRFAEEVDNRDLWHHFFIPLRARTHETAARLSQIDYDREMTLVAWQGERLAGLARAIADPDFETAECAVIIRADLREHGLGQQLLQALFGAIAALGVRHAVMRFPEEQTRIRAIADELGFDVGPDEAGLCASKALQNPKR
jgi:acetyltransferase